MHATIPKGDMGYDQYHCSWHWSCRNYFYWFRLALANIRPAFSCHSFKFFWGTVNSKPPKIPFGIVAWTFSNNLSRNSCIRPQIHSVRSVSFFVFFLLQVVLGKSVAEVAQNVIKHVRLSLLTPEELKQVEQENEKDKMIPVSASVESWI